VVVRLQAVVLVWVGELLPPRWVEVWVPHWVVVSALPRVAGEAQAQPEAGLARQQAASVVMVARQVEEQVVLVPLPVVVAVELMRLQVEQPVTVVLRGEA
jgi:hypothetical protein